MLAFELQFLSLFRLCLLRSHCPAFLVCYCSELLVGGLLGVVLVYLQLPLLLLLVWLMVMRMNRRV